MNKIETDIDVVMEILVVQREINDHMEVVVVVIAHIVKIIHKIMRD